MGYLNDTVEVSNLHTEYFRLINQFKDLTRPSIFLRYYNISQNASTFKRDVEATFNRYSTGVVYDVYDFTPCFQVDQLVNTAQERQDLIGKQFDGTLNIIIYTVDKPRFGDIVVFPYEPLSKAEVFRVKEISVAINALQANIKYFTLGLEYSAILNTDDLKLSRKLVYLLPSEKNIDQDIFKSIILNADLIESLLLQLTYNSSLELYEDTNKKIAPLNANKVIYDNLNSNRYFDKIKKPFGVCGYSTFKNSAIDISTNKQISIIENTPTNKKLSEYIIDKDNLIYDMANYLVQFTNLIINVS